MVIDSSALLAILSNEPEALAFAEAIQGSITRSLSAASFLETAIVIESRYGVGGGNKLDELISTAQIRIEPVTMEQIVVCTFCLSAIRKGPSSGRPQLRRLFCLCTGSGQ